MSIINLDFVNLKRNSISHNNHKNQPIFLFVSASSIEKYHISSLNRGSNYFPISFIQKGIYLKSTFYSHEIIVRKKRSTFDRKYIVLATILLSTFVWKWKLPFDLVSFSTNIYVVINSFQPMPLVSHDLRKKEIWHLLHFLTRLSLYRSVTRVTYPTFCWS